MWRCTTSSRHSFSPRHGFATATRLRVKTVEETYVKKTPIEHILMRPDLYVGPVAATQTTMWTPETLRKKGKRVGKVRMVENDVTYSPALLKIFDEVLVNAVDNVSRGAGCNRIEVANKDRQSASLHYAHFVHSGRGLPRLRVRLQQRSRYPDQASQHRKSVRAGVGFWPPAYRFKLRRHRGSCHWRAHGLR